MTNPAPDSAGARRWVNVRVVLILLALVAVICASVIVTDVLSPRDRQAAVPATAVGGGR